MNLGQASRKCLCENDAMHRHPTQRMPSVSVYVVQVVLSSFFCASSESGPLPMSMSVCASLCFYPPFYNTD